LSSINSIHSIPGLLLSEACGCFVTTPTTTVTKTATETQFLRQLLDVTTTATTQVSTTTTVATAYVPEGFELLEPGIAPTNCEFLPTDPNQTFVGGIRRLMVTNLHYSNVLPRAKDTMVSIIQFIANIIANP
jgi:hypothetical protein